MRNIPTVLMVILFCLGCAKSNPRGHVPPIAQNVVDAATLKAINEAQLDLRAAQELAFNPAPPSARIGDKVTKMGDQLSAGTCLHAADVKRIDPPAQPDFTKNWDFLWYVDSAGKAVCPAHITHSLNFVLDEKDASKAHLEIKRFYQATAGEFRKLSAFWYMDSSESSALFARKVPGGRVVDGNLRLTLKFDGLAHEVQVVITVSRTARGTEESGYAAVNVRIGPSSSAGSVSWNSTDAADGLYTLNSASITEKEFQSLFSAYGVRELIDYAKKM